MSPDIARDARRMFSRAQVRRVWERQGRVCVLCERAIPFDLMHGDHIHPWSAGGLTVFENCQALCEACPGAGKTHFGLEVAYRLLASGEISRLIVVTPTIGICDGWLEAASAANK